MALPKFYDANQPLMLMQSSWKSQLDPVLANPMNDILILKNISLINGVNVINHLLGRLMQGWILIDVNGAATIYRSAPLSDKTLTLTSSAIVTVSIGVF